MTIKKIDPYLTFDGNAKDAIAFYAKVLGAQVLGLQHFSDVPGMDVPEPHGARVMHARLLLDDCVIMVSDTFPGHPFVIGNNNHISLQFDNAEVMERKFAALAEGGSETMALHDAFWGARFGMVKDRFGVNWMFNCERDQSSLHEKQVFLNLPVANVQRSMEFFRALGFDFNERFTNEQAACMVVSKLGYAMLLDRSFFSTFTKRAIADTSSSIEGLFAISLASREAVQGMVKQALESGGSPAVEPQDHGFMFSWSFLDPDGHQWEPFWMNPNYQPE